MRSAWQVYAQRMSRFAVGIEYDGAAYAGWQTQQSLRTMQELVERALSGVAAERVELVCAGRTDAGVHARWQVAHFDTHVNRPLRGWVLGANTELPRDISLVWARPVPLHFHARYSAEARTYRYLILNRRRARRLRQIAPPAFIKPLDHERMAEAAVHSVRPPRLQRFPLLGVSVALADPARRAARRWSGRANGSSSRRRPTPFCIT